MVRSNDGRGKSSSPIPDALMRRRLRRRNQMFDRNKKKLELPQNTPALDKPESFTHSDKPKKEKDKGPTTNGTPEPGLASGAPLDSDEPASDAELLTELLNRRNQHVSLIEELAAKLETEIQSMKSLDEVISLYDRSHIPWRASDLTRNETPPPTDFINIEPEIFVKASFQTVDAFFGSDQRAEIVLGIMKRENRPLTSVEVTEQYALIKNAELDRELKVAITSRISSILDRLRKRGKVRNIDRPGWKNAWMVIQDSI